METKLGERIEKYTLLQNMFSRLNLSSDEEKKKFLIKNFFKVKRPDIESDSDSDEIDAQNCPHTTTFPDRFIIGAIVCTNCGSFVNYEPETPYALGSTLVNLPKEDTLAQIIAETPSESEHKISKQLDLLKEIYPNTEMDLNIIMNEYRKHKNKLNRDLPGVMFNDKAILYVAIEPYIESLSKHISKKDLKKKILNIKDDQISRIKGPLEILY